MGLAQSDDSPSSSSVPNSSVEGEEEKAVEKVWAAPTFSIPKSSSEIKIDGNLNEPAWSKALSLSLDYETRPGENIKPSRETECLLTYDERQVYVAFRAYDPEPEKVRARLNDRDSAFQDDFVGIVFDTFNDERRAFEFFVNPLGVQMDLTYDDVNSNEDESWDAIWSSAGRLTEFGYVVEYAIPFSSLRFPRTNDAQTWGIDVLRIVPRGDRIRLAINPQDRDRSCYLCQFSKLVGFEGITPGRNIEINPTLTAGRNDERDDFPNGALIDGDEESDLGLTASWGITPNLTLNGTINPDFSQVEADAAQLDINSQFALFFPERRPFFLEGADLFRSPINAVFTRNVADPSWGLKMTGKEGKNAIGVFVAEDDVTNLIFPGSQGSDAESFSFKTTDAVLRYRRDLGERSTLGALATHRQGSGFSNAVFGFDGSFRFSDADKLSAQILTSSTEYPTDIAEEFEQPLGTLDDEAFLISYNHNSRNWNAWARYEDIGKNFRADMGFLPRVDYTFLVTGLQRVWWGDDDNWYNFIRFGGDWDLTEDQSGQKLEEEWEVNVNIGGPKQSFLFAGVGTRERFFDGVTFDETFYSTFFEIRPTGALYAEFFARIGDQVDFANTQPGEITQFEPAVRLNIGKHWQARISHEFRQLDVAGGTLFEANLSQLRLVYQINRRAFVRAIFQNTDIDRDTDLYLEDDVDAKTERLFSQLLFSYKLNPRTVLFLGYSDNYKSENALELIQENRALFFKVGYAWVL